MNINENPKQDNSNQIQKSMRKMRQHNHCESILGNQLMQLITFTD